MADVGLENVRMDAYLDMGRVHLFDDQTGCNVSLEPEHVAHAS